MKTLKSIINAVLILLMAIYGLAMLALLILPFVDVTNLFPGAEVHYLSGWGYWLVSELQFAFYLALICLLRKEFKYLLAVGNDKSPSNGLQHISLALLGLSSL